MFGLVFLKFFFLRGAAETALWKNKKIEAVFLKFRYTFVQPIFFIKRKLLSNLIFKQSKKISYSKAQGGHIFNKWKRLICLKPDDKGTSNMTMKVEVTLCHFMNVTTVILVHPRKWPYNVHPPLFPSSQSYTIWPFTKIYFLVTLTQIPISLIFFFFNFYENTIIEFALTKIPLYIVDNYS